MTVKLVIKSATQMVDDFILDCDLSWTIGQVKEKITDVYPTNPKKENQKLIYGGKLLPDHLSLKSVLNHTQDRHIMHLVCPPSNVSNKQNVYKEAEASESFTVPPPNPAFPPVNQPILNPPSISGMPGVTVAPLNTGDAFQQYLAMQQMYAQFMTQYLSQYNGGVPPVIPYSPVMTVPPVQTPQVPAPQQSAPPNPPQRQAEEEDRDYLDYVHFISRAVLLFALLYYYSSLFRVLVVVAMFLCISIYGKIHRRNREFEMQRRAAERPSNETVPTQPVPTADIQETGSEEVASSEPTTSDATLSQQSEGRSIASVLSTTASLISAFFASLIPAEPPVPVNVN